MKMEHTVIERIESRSAQLGSISFILAFVTLFVYIFPSYRISPSFPSVLFVVGVVMFGFSFGTFKWQTRSKNSKNKILWGVVLLPFILYLPLNLLLLYIGVVELRLNDYGAYYNAAVRWLNGAPLYQTTRQVPTIEAQISGDMPFLYPPIFVLLFVPFTILPPITSGIAWNLSVLVLLLWSVSKLLSTFDYDITTSKRILVYLVVLSFAPTVTWLKLGQVSGLIAALLCLSAATLRSKQQKLSGIFTTVAALIKPFYATSGAHLLRHRDRFASSAGSAVVLFIIGILIFGVGTHLEYMDVLLKGKGWETTIRPSNWHATHFNPFYALGPLKHVPRVIIVLGTVGLALNSNRTEIPIEYIFALGVAIVPLAGPTTNTLALNAVVPAILVVGFYELDKTGEFPKVLVASGLLIHVHPYSVEFLSKFGPRIYPPIELLTPAVPFLQPALYGTGLLLGYLVYRTWTNPVV